MVTKCAISQSTINHNAQLVFNAVCLWLADEQAIFYDKPRYANPDERNQERFIDHLRKIERESGTMFYFDANSTPATARFKVEDWNSIGRMTQDLLVRRLPRVHPVRVKLVAYSLRRKRLEVTFE